ncbi:MAG: hypothetical protein WAU77_07515 [Solirubrobacteraceae bacterium]
MCLVAAARPTASAKARAEATKDKLDSAKPGAKRTITALKAEGGEIRTPETGVTRLLVFKTLKGVPSFGLLEPKSA